MADSIKINKLEIENVKRIKAVKIEPTKNGLTIVGGNNNQGKTSVLDSIAWALGGDRYKPSNATRDGSTIPPNLHIVMSNGLVVERKGKNSSLKVTDPNGNKGGQQLLNDFVEQLALDLPKFMESSGKEKAQTLLKIIGVGDQLTALEQQEKELYNERLYVGRTADQKVKFAKEQPYYPDAPKDLVSPSDLIKQQQEILARNGKNEEYRRNAVNMKAEYDSLNMEIENLRKMLQEKMERHEALSEALEAANKTVSELHDESTAELEASIANIEEINRKVRANLDKDKAEEDARAYQDQYNELTKKIEGVRDQKTELLNAADLPLPELSVKEGELIYKGQQWDNMSGSDRLKVSTAIVRKLNPKCGFVLLDKLEQMDLVTLNEFGQWMEQEGLGDVTLDYETKKCDYDRGRMFTVDAMDNIESAGIAFGRLSGEFLRTQVVPELDTWRLAKYAGYASGNNVVTGAIADGKAGIAAIRAGKTAIKNAEAKTETCYLFISTTLKGMIDDLDTTASKKAMEDWAGVIEVPASRFFDKVTLTKTGAGGFATTGGKAIDFLIVDKNAAIQYQKHTVSKIITPEQNQTADAWKFGYRTVGIAEAKDNKKVAIYVHKAGE